MMPFKVTEDEFYSDEQWEEHKTILKIPGARAFNKVDVPGHCFYVQYAINLNDYKFMVEYHGEGGTSLWILKPSFDNVRTLLEFLVNGKEVVLE
jgi:hypothetical protein